MSLARDVAPEAPRWVHEPHIARGVLTLVAGPRSMGKGLLAAWFTMKVTTGDPPLNVWINSLAEDDLGMTLRPRLDAVGADLDLVRITEEGYRLPKNLGRLERDVATLRPDILVLDSWQTHCPGNQMAEADTAEGLAHMARSAGVAIVVVGHMIKRIGRDVTSAVGGSNALQNRAKAIFILGPQPGEDAAARELRDLRAKLLGEGLEPDRREKLTLACERMGFAEIPPALSFAKSTTYYGPTDRTEAYLEYLGEVDFSAGEVLGAIREASKNTDTVRGTVHVIACWILEALAGQPNRMMPAPALLQAAISDGLIEKGGRTFERARAAAGVRGINPKELHRYFPVDVYAALSAADKACWWVGF